MSLLDKAWVHFEIVSPNEHTDLFSSAIVDTAQGRSQSSRADEVPREPTDEADRASAEHACWCRHDADFCVVINLTDLQVQDAGAGAGAGEIHEASGSCESGEGRGAGRRGDCERRGRGFCGLEILSGRGEVRALARGGSSCFTSVAVVSPSDGVLAYKRSKKAGPATNRTRKSRARHTSVRACAPRKLAAARCLDARHVRCLPPADPPSA